MLDGSSQNSGLGNETLSAFASDVPEIIQELPHNTILLTGPPGSGKTAAVFACAEELGWEVFEVYPGMARRNGANVDSLVGDVGKNHLVRKKQGATRQQSIATLLSSSTGSSEAGAESGCGDSGKISVEYQGDLVELQAGDTEQTFRQSLILLEEVDLLFKDDVNFWPAVTNLIKDCRRPVICTCNGKCPDHISLVPKDGLPLQKVLYFEPCAPDVATSYLQGLACAEGYTVPLDHIHELYSDTYQLSGADIPSDTSPSTAHLQLPDFDLRKAIHGLQMKCTTGGRWKSKNNCDWETDEIIRSGALEWPWDSPDDNHSELPANTKHTSLGSETKAEREENIRVLDAISQQEDLISYLDSSVLLPLSQRKEVSRACCTRGV
ncbi:hypothetical protein P691DRAFT_662682 [Macrolepiota fuliginosa MF-IS2]|uniref:AAA+ ATPase domain-containing protein n=1 Tax=Macrolepiota fuliginosa MF-IS2 TaxID=1400762 RepID=A0A9P5XIV3_9AGAR|nr:hypothetical protein P691DRAFT_662682 [Macrolepiota fuliginosa MF-IS2]